MPLASKLSLNELITRVGLILASLILLTSSFDIFLAVQVGGTYRFCQVLTLLLLPLAIVQARLTKPLRPLCLTWLILWWCVQVMFIPVSNYWLKSAGYVFWLALNILLIIGFVQLFSRSTHNITILVRCYLISFCVVVCFGIVQFLLPLFGIDSPLVAQWWIKDHLARVNGFSYEPSYFATYLLIGFVFAGALRSRSRNNHRTRLASLTRYLSGVGIVLSSSRIGILFMTLDILTYQIPPAWRFTRDLLRLRISPPRLRALLPGVLILTIISSVFIGFLYFLQEQPALVIMFLNGTGLSDTAAHSAQQRADAFTDTLTLFTRSPLIGQSLGGISSGIASLHGSTVRSFDDGKLFEGMSVFTEALAASGIIGILPFILFVGGTLWYPLKLARISESTYASWLRACVRALFFAWAVLQFNQNVLRPYLWAHIALLATVYSAAQRAVNEPAVQRQEPVLQPPLGIAPA